MQAYLSLSAHAPPLCSHPCPPDSVLSNSPLRSVRYHPNPYVRQQLQDRGRWKYNCRHQHCYWQLQQRTKYCNLIRKVRFYLYNRQRVFVPIQSGAQDLHSWWDDDLLGFKPLSLIIYLLPHRLTWTRYNIRTYTQQNMSLSETNQHGICVREMDS